MILGTSDSERGGRDRLGGMLLLSLLIHAVLLLLLFFSPSLPSPKMTFGPAYTVALVNNVSVSARPVERRDPTGGGVKELLSGGRSEAVVKRRLDAEAVVPIRTLEGRKRQDRTLEKAMEEIRRRAAAEPSPKTPPKGAAEAKPAADPKAVPGSPVAAGDAADAGAKVNAYYALIWSRIKGGWTLPPGILPGDALEAVIDLVILRSGTVTEINFEKRSGNRFFDDSALKAIQKATPFPPVPAGLGDSSLAVGIRFHSSEFKP